nr:reverse transcriptase domain, reverse transcriptase zinc-binding domain protein [Tanacetum cinerariifolium]
IIGVDVIKAVKEFFTNGRLLKELNHTIIALIPKVNTPARVTDYRPISCCNVLFKCISKIIANRLKDSLKRLGKRGIRLGDLLSPYLFTLIMEVFMLMLKRRVIKDALDDFKDASGLNPSMPKSKAYFCNVINYTKLTILNVLPFEEDHNMSRGKVKVAWDVVCLSKQEGGFGIRRLDHFNKALMVSHVWKLLSLKESL